MPPERSLSAQVALAICVGTALWVSFGVLAVTDADNSRRIGVLPPVSLLAASVSVVLAIAIRFRASWHTASPGFLTLLAVLPWLPIPVPDLFLVWAGPAVLLIWGAVASSLLALAVPAAGSRALEVFRDPRRAPWIAASLAFVVFLAIRLGQVGPPTGDEPHYLVIAQSLLQDGDLKVADNYQRQDYLQYYGGLLEPHFSRPGVTGRVIYSIHAPGLPILVAPAFYLGGYWAVAVFIALVVSAGSAFVWKAGHLLTRDPAAAWFGWAAAGLASPLALHAALVYPDPVASMILAGGILALAQASEHSRRQQDCLESRASARAIPWGIAQSLGLGVAVGILPWLHTRLALPAAFLGLTLILRLAGGPYPQALRHLFAITVPVGLSVTAWLAFFQTVYGTTNPAAPYGDHIPLGGEQVVAALLSLLVDQEFGIVSNAPVFLLLGAAIWSLFKHDRRLTLEVVSIVAPYALATSGFGMWWGGASPPGRFLVPVLLPLGLASAALWARCSDKGRAANLTLLGATVLVTTLLAFGRGGDLAYNHGTGRARLLEWVSPLVDLPAAFPSYFRLTAAPSIEEGSLLREVALPAIVWAASLFLSWRLFLALVIRLRATVQVIPLVASLALVTGAAVAVAINWRLERQPKLMATRSQLTLMAREDPSSRPVALQLFPFQWLRAADVRTQFSLKDTLTEAPDMLLLSEVPAGDYRIRVKSRGPSEGDLVLGIGRASAPAARWSLAGDSTLTETFHLPVDVSSISVTTDQLIRGTIEQLTLVPERWTAQSIETIGSRGQDAARYGSFVLFATDDRVLLDAAGFWVLGERQPNVVITTDRPVNFIEARVRNVGIANTVRLSVRQWSIERSLAADELWIVRVPVEGLGKVVRLQIHVSHGVSVGGRLLGCRVELGP